jgi:(p)ppGpp synthase/HD superfamily hydrolase
VSSRVDHDDQRGGPSLDDAVSLATRAHHGQVDKVGDDYIGHPMRVMSTVAGSAVAAGVDVEHAMMAAVLHDVVEDTGITVDDLLSLGYPAAVATAVDALTHRAGEPYQDYLARVAVDPVAVVVKTADMADNSDPARLARLAPADAERLAARYATRRHILDDLVARHRHDARGTPPEG